MSDAPRHGPPTPGPPPSSREADARTGDALADAVADLERRPADDLDGTAQAGTELHDRLTDRLRDLGSA